MELSSYITSVGNWGCGDILWKKYFWGAGKDRRERHDPPALLRAGFPLRPNATNLDALPEVQAATRPRGSSFSSS